MAGTTTMLGGMLVQVLDQKGDEEWAFVAVNLGDCKAYRWDTKNQKITDVTRGNRQKINDVRDPGGRLGPFISGAEPDLRNLRVHYSSCVEGDLIILVSDGVHDNLDPEYNGLNPSELSLEAVSDSWEHLKDEVAAEEAKYEWAMKLLTNIILSCTKELVRPVAEKLIDHAIKITNSSREFMQQNKGKRLPSDIKLYPGKMDHSTVMVLQVGKQTRALRSKSV